MSIETNITIQLSKALIRLLFRPTTEVFKTEAAGPADWHIDIKPSLRVQIPPYTPYVSPSAPWLQTVIGRIRNSILPNDSPPNERDGEEWLSQDAAYAAISFMQNGADLLPTEPHLYGTQDGDLVAEFETTDGNMTGIVSDTKTLLYAVGAENPDAPIHTTIERGSNHYRHDLKQFTDRFYASAHGTKMDSRR